MATERALVVEDDQALRRLLVDELSELGLEVESASTVAGAVGILGEFGVDIVVSDLRLPSASGLELLRWTRALQPPPAFIVITAFGTIPQAVEALRAGADDFLTKPLDLDHLGLSIRRALENRRLRDQVRRYRELLDADDFYGMIGRSRPMLHLYETVRRLARADGPVLIIGESGVGKELIARAVHQESSRASGPFLAVNCAAIPGELVESEFFGHAAGAFTGATESRKGLFLEADGGTLLLDEIAEMPLELQATLLRVLQDGRIRPVGGNHELPTDVRVIAATNRDIEDEVAAGRFREDLYYRLETFQLRVPPLRDRGEDLELLAVYFLHRFAARLDRDIRGFTPEALERIRDYPFPGNVRELMNTVERAVAFCEGRLIEPRHLPAKIRSALKPEEPGSLTGADDLTEELIGTGVLPTLREIENRYIHYVLEEVGGNKRRAAALLGIGRGTLYRRLGED